MIATLCKWSACLCQWVSEWVSEWVSVWVSVCVCVHDNLLISTFSFSSYIDILVSVLATKFTTKIHELVQSFKNIVFSCDHISSWLVGYISVSYTSASSFFPKWPYLELTYNDTFLFPTPQHLHGFCTDLALLRLFPDRWYPELVLTPTIV